MARTAPASAPSARDHILATAAEFFGAPVDDITAPGGENRSSFRLSIGGRSVIATLRPNFRRTHLEAFVLRELSAHCDDVPECIGVAGEVMFQSDVGSRRANLLVAELEPGLQRDLAAEAVGAIFRIHAAGRRTKLAEVLPHLGATPDWVEGLVGGIDGLEELTGGLSSRFDRAAVCEALLAPARQVVKWDCRAGNAAVGDDDRLRWFDFEYAGLRHGAEDIAWLIGDETWPLSPEAMVDVVIDAFDPACGIVMEDYLHYLAIYTTFHATQRLALIARETGKRGWASQDHIRRFDDAGRNPGFAAHIAGVAAYFSDQSELTAPLTANFLEAQKGFAAIATEPA
jgi:hypothetical protein